MAKPDTHRIISFTREVSEGDFRVPDLHRYLDSEFARAIGAEILRQGLFNKATVYDDAWCTHRVRYEVSVQLPIKGADEALARDEDFEFIAKALQDRPPHQRYPGDAEPLFGMGVPWSPPPPPPPAPLKLGPADRAKIFGTATPGALVPKKDDTK